MIRLCFCWLFVAFLAPLSGVAQTAARVSDLHFLSGTWTLQHEWGDMTETWSDTAGNNLVCAFRCVKDGQPVFYEFILIEQQGSTPVMRLRHFSPGSKAWEDKDSAHHYPLVSLTGRRAVFEKPDKTIRLIYTRQSATVLVGELERLGKDGKWQRDVFRYGLKGG